MENKRKTPFDFASFMMIFGRDFVNADIPSQDYKIKFSILFLGDSFNLVTWITYLFVSHIK